MKRRRVFDCDWRSGGGQRASAGDGGEKGKEKDEVGGGEMNFVCVDRGYS